MMVVVGVGSLVAVVIVVDIVVDNGDDFASSLPFSGTGSVVF